MKKIQLGTTTTLVSEFSLGCMNFGTKIDTTTSYQLLDQYVAAGGNFLDTANNYAFWNDGAFGGESEQVIGDWMRLRKNRADIFLATKVGALPTIAGTSLETAEGLSKTSILSAVEASLKRLQTTYIDLYYAHIDDTKIDLKETLLAFHDLIQSGKVLHIGCSNFTFERLQEANKVSMDFDLESYCCIQERYSYLQPAQDADFGVQEVLSNQLLSYCKDRKISMLAYSPLLNGFYNGGKTIKSQYMTFENERRLELVKTVAAELNITPNQVVLAWLVQTSPIIIPLIGVSTSKQLEENLDAINIVLSNKHLALLGQK